MNRNNYGTLMSIGLIWGTIKVWQEVSMTLSTDQNWSRLFSALGITLISIYLLVFISGLALFLVGAWNTDALNQADLKLGAANGPRWLVITALVTIVTIIYLYSAWQKILFSPWLQWVFAVGFAQVTLFIAAPDHKQKFSWSELALALALFLFPRIIQELRLLSSQALIYRVGTAAGFVVVLLLAFALYTEYGARIRAALIRERNKLGKFSIFLVAWLCITPIVHRYLVTPQTYVMYSDIRFAIMLLALWVAAYLVSTGSTSLITREALGLSLGVLLFTAFIARFTYNINSYPFSLSWSEGNRFYDYSLVFGQSLYNHVGKIINPYETPGRYFIWGVMFLWKGAPIWMHRLWNLILLTGPVLIFSALLTRRLSTPFLRYGTFLWFTLLLTVFAPLHPPFILVSILTILFAFDESPVKRGVAIAIAAYYASLSRFTWVFAPAAIGALIDLLLYYPARRGSLWRRLLPTIALIGVGVVAGVIPSLGSYFSLAEGNSLTSKQPLLWYRLLPNDILGPGVLFLALMYTLPLLLVIAWWISSKRWQLDWVQKTAFIGALGGFFAIGLVISTKIGGGGDLHNMDMYLITLIVVFVLGLMSVEEKAEWRNLPIWVIGPLVYLLLLTIYPFTPLDPGTSNDPVLDLPNDSQVTETLSLIQKDAVKYAKLGEVLFMDQRQLLAFGYVDAIPFVPDYEKKYMMDQAMGSNAAYFKPYYRDLADKRFSLIITEHLKTKLLQDMGGAFSEENDDWVRWVSNPTLCFYEPIYISTKNNVELLVPRQNPTGCEQYLQP